MDQLIAGCRQNDSRAQKALYDRYARQLFIVCCRYMKDQQLSEEVLMNGFLRFFQTIGKFEYRNESSLVAWLKKIMVNECLMELRKQHSFLQVADEPVDMVDDPEVFDRMNAADIYRLILQLPVGYRTVFNLFSVENFSHAEIAKMLAISEGTSKSQFHKARKLLQQMVTTQNEYYAVQENK